MKHDVPTTLNGAKIYYNSLSSKSVIPNAISISMLGELCVVTNRLSASVGEATYGDVFRNPKASSSLSESFSE